MFLIMGEEKFYLTEEGLKALKKEYEELQKIRALKIKGEVPDILHSEEINPEYLSFQQDMSFLEGRIAELENILKNAIIIKPPPKEKQDKVNLGATVLVEVDGRLDEFTIVGSLEANPSVGKISNQSPVVKALLGKKVGEVVFIIIRS
jgi:transcription elongation factor GreA